MKPIQSRRSSKKWLKAANKVGFKLDIMPEYLITPRRYKKPRYSGPIAVDLFAGVGGFSLGFHMAGFHVPLCIDFDQWAMLTYMANLGKSRAKPVTYICKDIRETTGLDIVNALDEMGYLPIVDCVIGSPPCQDFSTVNTKAWKTAGDCSIGSRYCLFEYARIVKELRPRVFVMENVPGLVAKRMKPIFDSFLLELRSAGYSVNWKILNAADYGVPQNRHRVFAIGTILGDVFEYDPWNVKALMIQHNLQAAKLAWQEEAIKVWPEYWKEFLAEGLQKFMTYEEAELGLAF